MWKFPQIGGVGNLPSSLGFVWHLVIRRIIRNVLFPQFKEHNCQMSHRLKIRIQKVSLNSAKLFIEFMTLLWLLKQLCFVYHPTVPSPTPGESALRLQRHRTGARTRAVAMGAAGWDGSSFGLLGCSSEPFLSPHSAPSSTTSQNAKCSFVVPQDDTDRVILG